MIKGGHGGGNTKTGLIFEGKTDLAAFLSAQNGYRIESTNVYFNDELVARVFKKHKFYSVFLKELGINWKDYISKEGIQKAVVKSKSGCRIHLSA